MIKREIIKREKVKGVLTLHKITIYFVLIYLIAGCTKRSPNIDSNSVHMRLTAEVSTLDWNRATEVQTQALFFNMMEPLINYDFSDPRVKPLPGLITKWQQNESKTKYTITLQQNRFWSDGAPFTSQHVFDSLKRLLSPQTGAPNAFLFYPIRGARDFNQGKMSDFSKVGAKVLDSNTIEFNLESAFAPFMMLFGLYNILPIRSDLIEKYGEREAFLPSKLVTLGPYKISETSTTREIRLIKNTIFNVQLKHKIAEWIFHVIEEDATALALFESGHLNIFESPPTELIPQLNKQPEYVKKENLAIEYLGFNTQLEPFNHIKNRKALACSISFPHLEKLLSGQEKINRILIPKGIEGFKEDFDWGCSKPLKDVAKYKIKLSYYTNESQKKLMEFFQQELTKKLGWEVELDHQEWKVYLSKVNSTPPMVYRMGWMAIFPDPVLFLGLFTSDSHFNTTGWNNPEYDEIFNSVRTLEPSRERTNKISQAMRILIKDHQVVVPLYNGARHYMIKTSLQKKIAISPMGRVSPL